MSILDWGAKTAEQYIECRQCGQTIDDPSQPCPECNSTETAVYNL